jgi:hemolysin D
VVQSRHCERSEAILCRGQPVEVKVETFTFTRYGLLHGTVESVSRDAVTEDQRKRPDEQASDSRDQRDADKAGEPVYVARIRLDRNSVMVDGRKLGKIGVRPQFSQH